MLIIYRRDTSESEWMRILALLNVGSDLYSNMTQQDLEDSCTAKIVCEAFESSEIFGT